MFFESKQGDEIMEHLDTTVATVKVEAAAIEAEAGFVGIRTAQDLEDAGAFLVRIKAERRKIEDRRRFFVDPLNAQVKRINELFRKIAEPLDRADSVVRAKVMEYRKRQQEIARAEQERLDREAARAQERVDKKAARIGIAAPQVVVPVVPVLPPTVAGATVRRVWTFRVVDASKLPREYLVVDAVAIREAVRAGVRQIPGVEIFQDETLAVR